MRRLLLFFSVILLSQSLVRAYDFEADGICYDITGTTEASVTFGIDYSGKIIIPETVDYNLTTYNVTSIGESAFESCTNLTEVTIPSTITSIGDYAFYKCSKLTSMIIPNSVITIGDHVFYQCTGLKSVTISSCITVISKYAFYMCNSLTEVIIPSSVISIGDYAFQSCSSLTELTIPNGVETIGRSAFAGCSNVTSVTISNSVTTIGDSAFYECYELTGLNIGNSVTTIGKYAFGLCRKLTEVTIPDSVTTIVEWAFYNCERLKNVTIGKNVITIGDCAFYGCEKLMEIHSMNPTPPTISRDTFYEVDKEACVLYVPEGCKDIYSTTAYWEEFFNIQEDTSGIEDAVIDNDGMVVESEAGAIVIKGVNVPVCAYDLNGILLYQGIVQQETRIELPAGKIYIVKAREQSTKVLVK